MFDRKRFIRLLAVIRKEITEILHQTRLILTLIVGPFLILFLFGIGFRNESPPRKVVLLNPYGDTLQAQIDTLLAELGDNIDLVATTADPDVAERLLERGAADLIILPPRDPIADIRDNEQSEITFFHSEIDPFEEATVFVLGRAAADQLNQEILTIAADQGKVEADRARDSVVDTRANSSSLRAALEAGDEAQAETELEELQNNVDKLALAVGAMAVYASLEESIGLEALNESGDNPFLDATVDLRTRAENMVLSGSDDYEEELASLDQIDKDLNTVEGAIGQFTGIDSAILVSPFRAKILRLADISLDNIDFFVPAALALLIQHIAISFAALSIIRERRLGALQLLRIAPSSAGELVLGKTLGYLLVTLGIATVLTLLVTLVMGVPMAGNWLAYSGVILGVALFSLSLGFVISTISRTETQAVQFAMLVLLSSVFFSGLFLAVERIWEPVRIISWLLPATYGTFLLQDIMLRGAALKLPIFLPLLGLTVLTFLAAWRLVAGYMRRE